VIIQKFQTLKDLIDEERLTFSNIFVHDSRHRYYVVSYSIQENWMKICYGDD